MWLLLLSCLLVVLAAGNGSQIFDPADLGLHPPLGPIKVYVYSSADSAALAGLLACDTSAQTAEGEVEERVIDSFQRSVSRTTHATEADLFFVPARATCLGAQNGGDVTRWYKAAVESLPHFQFSGGRNHVFPFLSQDGPAIFKDWYHYVHQSIFIMLRSNLDSQTPSNPADLRQAPFQHYKDILVPWHLRNPHAGELASQQKTMATGTRQHVLAVPWDANLHTLSSLPSTDVLVSEFGHAELSRATFCLVPQDGPRWSMRAYKALYAGCIPVFLTDNLIEMPFGMALDWSKLSIKWPPLKADQRLIGYLKRIPDALIADTRKYIAEVECLLLWEGSAETTCSPFAAVMAHLTRKRRVFGHSPTTFWTLGSQPLNRSLAPFEAWQPPFVVEDVFLPMPKTCYKCQEHPVPGTQVTCWQAASYMHCKLGTDSSKRPTAVSGRSLLASAQLSGAGGTQSSWLPAPAEQPTPTAAAVDYLALLPASASFRWRGLSAWHEPRLRADSDSIFGEHISASGCNDPYTVPWMP